MAEKQTETTEAWAAGAEKGLSSTNRSLLTYRRAWENCLRQANVELDLRLREQAELDNQ